MKLVVHCLVKNEEKFIWYAIQSVIDYVDKILVWDTGSTDKTIEIIKAIKSSKINFKQVSGDITLLRQKMLEETDSEWILILDGDEIWWKDSITEAIDIISKNRNIMAIVHENIMLTGDMYHYLPSNLGKYRIAGRTGHLNIRFIKNISGLHVNGKYPNESYNHADGTKVQNLDKSKIYFASLPYLHASFIVRSSIDKKKIKYDRGNTFSLDYFYPEVFFRNDVPESIPFVFYPSKLIFKIRSTILMPIKKLKRRFI